MEGTRVAGRQPFMPASRILEGRPPEQHPRRQTTTRNAAGAGYQGRSPCLVIRQPNRRVFVKGEQSLLRNICALHATADWLNVKLKSVLTAFAISFSQKSRQCRRRFGVKLFKFFWS